MTVKQLTRAITGVTVWESVCPLSFPPAPPLLPRGRGKMSGYFPYEGKGEIGALTFPPPLAPMGRGMEGG